MQRLPLIDSCIPLRIANGSGLQACHLRGLHAAQPLGPHPAEINVSEIENRSTQFASPKIIAVTGATGLIGRRLLPALQQAGSQLRLLTHTQRASVAGEQVQGNLLDEAALRSLVRGADAVVHLAAVAHTRLRTPEDRAHARRVNVEGTRLLLRAAQEAGASRFVLLSSAHVYAGQYGLSLTENSATAGDTPYGALKLEAEQLAAEAEAHGLRVTVLRPCLTYGPGVRFNLQSLLRAVRRGMYVRVRGARTVRSLASVDTVSATIVHLLRSPQGSGTFNVADATPVVLEDWVDRLADRMQVRRPRAVPRWALETLATVGSAASALGLPAPVTRDTLRKLTSPFSLDVSKLAATAFVWPATQEAVIGQTIQAEVEASS